MRRHAPVETLRPNAPPPIGILLALTPRPPIPLALSARTPGGPRQ